MKRDLFPICYGAALMLFTTYLALDTFVLPDTYQTNTTQINDAMFEHAASAAEEEADAAPQTAAEIATETDAPETTAALVETISEPQIMLTEYYEYDTKIYVADVYLGSASQLKTAFAEDTYGRNITAVTSEIAAANGATLAINGDFYGARERGYVIRNGVVYRDIADSADILCIYADGTMAVVSPDAYTAEELVAQGVWQAFSFGPGLITDGTVSVTEDQEVGRAMASNPRTALGIIAPNHFVFVVSDGRTDESAGLSLYELAEFMQSLGVTTAYNLDGGGSSTMYFNGTVVNNPTTNGRIKERSVSDIVYIG